MIQDGYVPLLDLALRASHDYKKIFKKFVILVSRKEKKIRVVTPAVYTRGVGRTAVILGVI